MRARKPQLLRPLHAQGMNSGMRCLCIMAGWIMLLLVAASPWYQIHLNATDSLPGRLYLVDTSDRTPVRGATIAMRWQGGYGYVAGATLLKRVYGLPGDRITVQDRWVGIEGAPIAWALTTSPRGRPLPLVQPGKVPTGELFLATPSALGFDSRYASFGTIPQTQVLGRAYEIF